MADQTLNGRLCAIVKELVDRGVPLEQGRRVFEKLFIIESLRSHDGSIGRSAKSLGVHRNTLRNKVHRLDIDVEELGVRSGRRQKRS